MRYIILTIFTLITVITCAQDKKLDKLKAMFDEGKYEDCAYKAENLTYNDKYRKSPIPYLYISKCYFEILKMDQEDLDQEYKDPLKSSLKYAGKFASKDKSGSQWLKNTEFLAKLKTVAIEAAQDYYNSLNYKKAAGVYKMIMKYDAKDANIQFMRGLCEILSKNVGEGSFNIKNGMANVYKNYYTDGFEPDDVSEPVLIEGLVKYSEFLRESSADSAKATIKFAKEHFSDQVNVQRQFESIFN